MVRFRNFKRGRQTGLSWLLALLLLATTSSLSNACMSVPPPGAQIDIAQESAVIVWDAATQTEHFIRNATFHSTARDFGFLVPSPSVPTLSIVDEQLFFTLDRLLLPKHEQRSKTIYDFNPLLIGRQPITGSAVQGTLATAAGGVSQFTYSKARPASAVRVLASQRLGTYDTAVLEADNALALNHWLAAHGYAARPSLTRWLEPYIAAHWKITAFKITSSQPAYEQALVRQQVEMPPIRMSFHTDKPFYPYREPAHEQDAPSAGKPLGDAPLADAPFTGTPLTSARFTGAKEKPTSRLLRIYMLSSERMNGSLDGRVSALAWPGRVTWTDALPTQERDNLTTAINTAPDGSEADVPSHSAKGARLPVSLRLTVFEDRSLPRPGIADVYFERSSDQSSITPPPIIDYDIHVVAIPADVVFVMLVGIAGVSVFVWRRQAARRFRRQKQLV